MQSFPALVYLKLGKTATLFRLQFYFNDFWFIESQQPTFLEFEPQPSKGHYSVR